MISLFSKVVLVVAVRAALAVRAVAMLGNDSSLPSGSVRGDRGFLRPGNGGSTSRI